MNWVTYLFGSGLVFFLGVTILIVTVGMAWRGWLSRLQGILAILASLLIALSATPLPYPFYVFWAAVVAAWFMGERLERLATRRKWLRIAVVVVSALAAAIELPYHVASTANVRGQAITLFGDSVSDYMDGGPSSAARWPQRLAVRLGVHVDDRARSGATVGSTIHNLTSIPAGERTVLLEIGGNDLLGGHSAAQFERDLEQLLESVSSPERNLVMFELPLPPFANDFGRAQRRLAARYHATLIPKRLFIGVLTTQRAADDGIHLTARGHELMDEVVGPLLVPSARTRP